MQITTARPGVAVTAWKGDVVYAKEGCIVNARPGSTVYAFSGSFVHADNNATVYEHPGSTVKGFSRTDSILTYVSPGGLDLNDRRYPYDSVAPLCKLMGVRYKYHGAKLFVDKRGLSREVSK